MNADLLKQALEKVGNPNILVNIVSKRVRQLNSAGGAGSRPLLQETATLGVGDIALTEICEEKMSWEMHDPIIEPEPTTPKRRSRS